MVENKWRISGHSCPGISDESEESIFQKDRHRHEPSSWQLGNKELPGVTWLAQTSLISARVPSPLMCVISSSTCRKTCFVQWNNCTSCLQMTVTCRKLKLLCVGNFRGQLLLQIAVVQWEHLLMGNRRLSLAFWKFLWRYLCSAVFKANWSGNTHIRNYYPLLTSAEIKYRVKTVWTDQSVGK